MIFIDVSKAAYSRVLTHTNERGRACHVGSTISRAHRLALLSFALPEAPTFVLADLTYTSCSPSAILFLSGRAVHWRKHGRMPPHMGQTMADTRGPRPLFARSCFDEVGLRPYNAVTFFSYLFFSLFFSLFRVFSLLASFSLSRYLLPSVSTPEFRCLTMIL